ncbi:MAG: hypothetical protein LUG60_08910 [Erysipelotrichaceae bacterium]|nr:hypothetical protein [Erysipelotrichaceae bacterium]
MFECQFDDNRRKEMKKYFPKSLKYFDYTIEKYGTIPSKKLGRPDIILD